MLLLLWGLGGVSIYVAYFIESPEEFALTAETAQNRDAYAAYVAQIPSWIIAVGLVAALARLSGAIALLLRRAWAVPLYVVSLAFFIVVLFRAFVMTNVAEVMSAGHMAIEAVFLMLSIFATWFAYVARARGVLR